MESLLIRRLLDGAGVRGTSSIRQPEWFACLALGLQCFVGVATAFGQPVGPSSIFDGGQPGAHFGFSVASAGDVNGDGFSDVLVGAPDAEDGQPGEGIARLFLGSASGLLPSPAWTRGGDQPQARFGFCVASAGDVNGDGYSDVVVGAPAFDAGLDDQGAVFLFLGSAGGLSTAPAHVWHGNQAGEQFGSSVAGAGDVDTDGFADVLIGAPGFDGGQNDEGAGYLFRGAAATLPAVPAWSTEGNQAGASLGSSVASLGDMNGDGFGDVAIGAPLFDGGQIDEGQVRVFAGNSTGLDASPLQNFEANKQGSHFGFSIAGAGNLAGDGRPRVLFGAPIYAYTHIEEGGTFLGGLGQTPFFLDFGRQDFAHRGASIASAGDVNGDGLEDVVIGADQYDQGELDEGVVTVHAGHPSFVVDRTPIWVVDVDQASCAFGFSVACAGDVNGDGYDDIVAGAPRYDHEHADEGRALVFLGPSGVTAVGDEPATLGIPVFRLVGPNPFRASTSAIYSIPRGGRVQIFVLDVQGRRLAQLVDEMKASGAHVVTWDGRDESGADCGPGVYFLRLGFERDVTVCKAVRLE